MSNRKLPPSRGKVAPSSAGNSSILIRRSISDSASAKRLPSVDATTSKTRSRSEVRVEQIEDGPKADVKQATHGQSARDSNRLRLPEIDVDDSSDSSSMLSPRSDSETEHSIAVDCHTNPSEVIVKGKNVKQIRVKFPPHPPNIEEASRTKSGRHRLRRTASGTSIRDDDNVPYSQEETSLPAISETPVDHSMMSSFPHLNPAETSISLHSQDPTAYSHQYSSTTARSHIIDWDLKHRQDVLSGLEYFERKATDFKELYNQSQHALDRLRRQNSELDEQVKKLESDNKQLWGESDELKIRLDASEKENSILQNQAITEWQSRVKLEEMYVELQRDSDKEIASLKEKLSERSMVGKSVHNVELRMGVGGDKVDGILHAKEHPKGGLSDDQFELMHSISRLQDDLKKLTREKDSLADHNGRLHQNIADLKSAFREKNQELESQQKRFLSLKKSFNDLSDENEKLKIQMRARGASSQLHPTREQIANVLANSTWPGNPAGKAHSEVESVSYIDLPKGSLAAVKTASSGHQAASLKGRRGSIGHKSVVKGTNGMAQHKRTKSDVISLQENLPPVANPSR